MKICNPYITDPANVKWLEENQESFIDYIAKNHSVFDIAHTILHIDTMNDKYVANLIAKVEGAQKRKILEEKAQAKAAKAKLAKNPPKKTAQEQKKENFEKAIEAKQKEIEDEYELPD